MEARIGLFQKNVVCVAGSSSSGTSAWAPYWILAEERLRKSEGIFCKGENNQDHQLRSQ